MTEIDDQIKAALVAWERAAEMIGVAWKATPGFLLQTRAPVSHDLKNQTIAYNAADAMIAECKERQRRLQVNRFERSRGRGVSDEEALEQ